MPEFFSQFGGTFPQWGTFGVAVATLAGLVAAYIKGWPERKRAMTEAATADADRHDTANQRLIDNLLRRMESMNGRITGLEQEIDDCRRREAEMRSQHAEEIGELKAQIGQLQGLVAGLGDARQHAQLIVSAEKRKGVQ